MARTLLLQRLQPLNVGIPICRNRQCSAFDSHCSASDGTDCDKKQEKLLALLPEESQERFEDFVMAMGDVEILQDEEIYRQGFCFGMQLTAEVYVMNKNKLVTYGDE